MLNLVHEHLNEQETILTKGPIRIHHVSLAWPAAAVHKTCGHLHPVEICVPVRSRALLSATSVFVHEDLYIGAFFAHPSFGPPFRHFYTRTMATRTTMFICDIKYRTLPLSNKKNSPLTPTLPFSLFFPSKKATQTKTPTSSSSTPHKSAPSPVCRRRSTKTRKCYTRLISSSINQRCTSQLRVPFPAEPTR